MKKHPIATLVNFCTNESCYLSSCLEQALLFSRQVIVSICDHFFDGSPENQPLLEAIYSAFPDCLFIEYPYIPKRIPKAIFKAIPPAHFWHSFSRLIGAAFLDEEIEAVLFLDADEIPEGEKVKEWLEASDYQQHVVLKLANYWYFRLPEYQALEWEDSGVLVQKKALSPEILLRTEERDAIYDSLPGPKKRRVTGNDGAPMFHHYSWVRTEEEMLKKVKTWGHRSDRDWEALVKEEFSRSFSGVDFVHGYRFQSVTCPFKIHFGPPLFSPKGPPRVRRLSPDDLFKFLKFMRQQNPLGKFLNLFLPS